jgi:hypothetical protein
MEPIKTYTSGTSNYKSYNNHTIYIEPMNFDYKQTTSPLNLTLSPSYPSLTIFNNGEIQNKVAVFKVTRDENQKITSSKFIKELWIESKNGSSIDFEVAKDTEISKFEANEIIIKVIHTFTL